MPKYTVIADEHLAGLRENRSARATAQEIVEWWDAESNRANRVINPWGSGEAARLFSARQYQKWKAFMDSWSIEIDGQGWQLEADEYNALKDAVTTLAFGLDSVLEAPTTYMVVQRVAEEIVEEAADAIEEAARQVQDVSLGALLGKVALGTGVALGLGYAVSKLRR